jgi:glycosyltransferase involved in cell wall biosynthesis
MVLVLTQGGDFYTMPLHFSIIVATLNRKMMLLQALDSIYSQDFPTLEIVVVDGGSTDGTIQAVRSLPRVTFIAGPDQGLYHAFNKGLSQARGEVVGILNSDDLYEPDTFKAVEQGFADNPGVESICGTATLFEGDRTLAVYDDEACKVLTPRAALIGSSLLNARFFRRKSLLRVGLFDLRYRFVADRDFLARCFESRITTIPIRDRVYRYRQHAESLTFSNDTQRKAAIYFELLRLARAWRYATPVSSEMKRMALFLEGRCIAKLAQAELKAGHFSAGLRHLLTDGGGFSLAPVYAMMAGGADWLVQRRPLRATITYP